MRRRNEGLTFLYKIAGLSILRYMQRYPSINTRKTLDKIWEATQMFDTNLTILNENSKCLSTSYLEKNNLYKRKYPVYGAYLAAISSIPILYRVARDSDIISSIFAKMSMVASIKLLDNINDRLHNSDQAIRSQQMHEQALTQDTFYLNEINEDDSWWVYRAENSAYWMSRWAYHTLVRSIDYTTKTFNLFKNDMHIYINGQTESFRQRFSKFTDATISLPEYLGNILEKGFGKPWIDIDFCFYEKAAGKLTSNDAIAMEHINRSLGLLFKSLCIYDDLTDLREDLNDGIINSVMILGMDQGKLSVNDVLNNDYKSQSRLIRKLEAHGVIQDAIYLSDIVFLKAVRYLLEARECTEQIDVDALLYCARILRLFLLRKRVLEKRDFRSAYTFMQSFEDFERLQTLIPEHIVSISTLLEKDYSKTPSIASTARSLM